MFKKIYRLIIRVIAHEEAKPFFTYPVFLFRVWLCRRRYARNLSICRAKAARGEKLRVIFLVSNCSKWKCQGIYELMEKSDVYEPLMAITTCDDELYLSDEQLQSRIDNDVAYYERIGNRWILACEVKTRKVCLLSQFKADIVFMQVPWGLLKGQTVFSISKYALVCYVPYGIDCTEVVGKGRRFNWHHLAYFHMLLWRYFAISESFADYLKMPHLAFERSGSVVGVGHPSLDPPKAMLRDETLDGCVIYAPHFGFEWNGIRPIVLFSTFYWSGRYMLEYAKKHPEVRWVFKPHPLLKERVLINGFMNQSEVDAYYEAWEKVAVSCYDAGYKKLFHNSRAMITDCGSFLFEYSAEDKPLIRLVPNNTNIRPADPAREVFESFYTCHDLHDLEMALSEVVENGKDPRREQRHGAVTRAGLLSMNAAENICLHINRCLQLPQQG